MTDEAVSPAGSPPWPTAITAEVGGLSLRFESRSFWTLYRIDYRGKRIGLDRWGSHYGSVAKFTGLGFVGSGHTENEDEEILALRFEVDGKRLDPPPASVNGQVIHLHKRSRIRGLILETSIEVRENAMDERVRVYVEANSAVDLIYHFMHPWTPAMTHYRGLLLDGRAVSGRFDGDRAMEIDAPTQWSAVYSNSLGAGAVTVVLDAPDTGWRTRYWDVPGRYRKHYFTTLLDSELSPGSEYSYAIRVLPFEAAAETWAQDAEELAGRGKSRG